MTLLCLAPLLVMASEKDFAKALQNLGEAPEHKLKTILDLVTHAISLEEMVDLSPKQKPTGSS